MAFHIFYDNKCPQCRKVYFPVKDRQICGACGAEIKNNKSIVNEIGNGMLLYRKFNNGFTPHVFGACSVSDTFLLLIYQLFDKYEEAGVKDFEKFMANYFKTIQFGANVYIKENIFELVFELHKYFVIKNYFPIK
ncbi:hypothetical protein J7L48_03730, partial [bacterium]|nr:hypothetical protein [bacterium]